MMRRRNVIAIAGVGALLGLAQDGKADPPPPNAFAKDAQKELPFEPPVKRQVSATVEEWTIVRPNVKQPRTDYPQVKFRPGDAVRVEAGGCVNRGGWGRTRYRYVDPSDTSELYRGEIEIPGITPMVKITRAAHWMKGWQRIPTIDGGGPKELVLSLGYTDDGYGDNGYYGRHDDGPSDQCKGVEDAWVRIFIDHEPPASVGNDQGHKPMDIHWSEVDQNLLPKNPWWNIQSQTKGEPPDPVKLCNLNAVHRWSAYAVSDDPAQLKSCTSTVTKLDIVRWVASGPVCWGVFPGHANWFPVSFDGRIWQDSAPKWGGGEDQDYSFNLMPLDAHGNKTTHLFTSDWGGHPQPHERGLHLEVWRSESIGMFQLPFWTKYRDEVGVDALQGLPGDSEHKPAPILDTRRAIATGLVGLDCAHNCHVELHPLFALAVQDQASEKSEHWAFYAKNWGNGGFCSSSDYELDLPEENGRFVYKFHMPWRPNATTFSAHGEFVVHAASDGAVKKGSVSVHGTPGVGVLVTVTLPAPADRGAVEGEVQIDWVMHSSAKPAPPPPPPPSSPSSGERRIDHDHILEALHSKLTPAQRKALPPIEEPDRAHQTSARLKFTHTTGPMPGPTKPGYTPRVRAVPNPAKETRAKAHMDAIKKALGSDAAYRDALREAGKELKLTPQQIEEMLKAR